MEKLYNIIGRDGIYRILGEGRMVVVENIENGKKLPVEKKSLIEIINENEVVTPNPAVEAWPTQIENVVEDVPESLVTVVVETVIEETPKKTRKPRTKKS